MKTELTAARLRELLHYDPETGIFTYALGILGRRRVEVGAVAGGLDNEGYRRHSLDNRFHRAHRLAWLYVHGVWPAGEVDHINGIRDDNRIANLRDVPRLTNSENFRKARRCNKTGLLGVTSPAKQDKKFTATITAKGVRKSLGRFDTAEEAHQCYLTAKREMHSGCTI